MGPSNAINATLYDKLNFNFVRDIAPVAPIVRFPYIMMVKLNAYGRGGRSMLPQSLKNKKF